MITWMRGRWWLVIAFAVIGGLASVVIVRRTEPVYQATTTLLVGDVAGARDASRDDIKASVSIASTYARLIRSHETLDPVIAELDLPATFAELKDRVHVDLGMSETPIITVAVLADSPEEAKVVATSIGERAAALGVPDTSPAAEGQGDAPTFLQLRTLEADIVGEEARITRIEDAIASARTPAARARLRPRYEQHAELLLEMHATYAARSLPADQRVPSSLQVLQPALAGDSLLRPNTPVNVALGIIIGASAGFGLAYGVAVRRDRRARRIGRHGMQAADPWILELSDPR